MLSLRQYRGGSDPCGGVVDGPFGSNLPASGYVTEGIPVIRGSNLSLGKEKFKQHEFVYISQDAFEKLQRSECLPNDIIFTKKGTLGQTGIIPNPSIFTRYILSSNQMRLRVDPLKALPAYIYYVVSSPQTIEKIIRDSDCTGVPKINLEYLRKFPVKLPDLKTQKAIAHILGSLDDKIELNRQMNETLEAMAQALFKSWFVDFDPVIDNALAVGNAIPDEFIERAEQRKGIDKKDNADIQSLFPEEFEFTEEMGWIPKGWSVQSFGDLLDSTIGGDWGKLEEDEKHTKESVIIRGTDIPKLKIGERSEAPNRWVEEKKLKTRILRPFDIVIEISGGSPTQSTGRSIIITEQILERLGGVAEPASFCRKFSPSNKFLGLYAGIHLQKIYDDGKMWEYQNQSTGIANFQTTSFLEREQLVVPNESVLLKFYETLDPVISKMNSNQQIELAKLRDTLLPKLMSGELRISDAAELVDEAV